MSPYVVGFVLGIWLCAIGAFFVYYACIPPWWQGALTVTLFTPPISGPLCVLIEHFTNQG